MQAIPQNAPAPAESDTANPMLDLLLNKPVAAGQAPERVDGIVVGRFAGLGPEGQPLVDIPAYALHGLTALSVTPCDTHVAGEQVALGFEGGNPQRPIILGFMQPLSGTASTAVTLVRDDEDEAHLVIEAEQQLELRCGDAALILSADGRIQLRGSYITSHATATQRILGGSVQIN